VRASPPNFDEACAHEGTTKTARSDLWEFRHRTDLCGGDDDSLDAKRVSIRRRERIAFVTPNGNGQFDRISSHAERILDRLTLRVDLWKRWNRHTKAAGDFRLEDHRVC